MPKMRTISEAYAEIKAADPNTCLTLHGLKVMVRTGEVPSIMRGKKYLIDLDYLIKYLSGDVLYMSQKDEPAKGNIRRIDI